MPGTRGSVVVVNCGSSSVKLALVDPVTGERSLSCLGERLGTPDAVVHMTTTVGGEKRTRTITPAATTHRGALAHVLQRLLDMDLPPLLGVGHRVVQGGSLFRGSVRIDDRVLGQIAELSALAPLHNPANVSGIEAARAVLPELEHVAVFDTAFHQTMPEASYRYAVPQRWYEEFGVRRYGMHGTSHRFVSERAGRLLAEATGADPRRLKLVVAHLGNGCSATAVLGGRSVDTTMGLTPLEGLVMGTRSGDLDPAVLELVAERTGEGVAEIVRQLNSASGLLALSGLSNDVRTLWDKAAEGHTGAKLALDVFAHRAAKHVAALTVPLGGLDALVLTGGIGENAVGVRSMLLSRLAHLGLVEDPAANAAHGRGSLPEGRITRAREDGSAGPLALVVPTDEELLIARDTVELVEHR